MISNLIYIKRRNRFIIKLILELFDQGKNILCLSGRILQIDLFYKLLDDNEYTKNHVGKYIGGMSDDKLKISANKQIILGTFAMAEEGLDIQNLNVVILCTPKSAIKQPVGRILRKDVYEEFPIVIDIIDEDNIIFKRQANTRDTYYRSQKYNIQSFKISDYPVDGWTKWDDELAIQKFLTSVPDIKKSNPKPEISYIKFNPEEIEFLED